MYLVRYDPTVYKSAWKLFLILVYTPRETPFIPLMLIHLVPWLHFNGYIDFGILATHHTCAYYLFSVYFFIGYFVRKSV